MIIINSSLGSTGTNFSVTLDTNTTGWNGYTKIIEYTVAGLTLPSGAISQMRVTFEASSVKAFTITNAYIGQAAASGDAYDFSATPVQLLFGGSASKALAIGESVTTDWANFAYDKTTSLLVAIYLNGGTSVDGMRFKTTVSNANLYHKIANDAATVNKTGYTLVSNRSDSINKIESDGF